MMQLSGGDWIALASVVSVIMLAMVGYLRNPPLIRMSQVSGMREKLEELRIEIVELKSRITELQTINQNLRDQVYWAMNRLSQAEQQIGPKAPRSPKPLREDE